MTASIIDQLRNQAAEQAGARRELVDGFLSARFPRPVQWGFVAFPPLDLLAEDQNERLAVSVVRFSLKFRKRFVRASRTGDPREMMSVLESSLQQLMDICRRRDGLRYRDIAVLYSQILGPVSMLILRSRVDWERVHRAERDAFDGVFRPELWWPEWWPADFERRCQRFVEDHEKGWVKPGETNWEAFHDYVKASASLVTQLRVENPNLHDAVRKALGLS
ncbi:MAG: hypothetical protein ACRDXD_04240 [Acidimicrobiia bacterium]